MGALRGSARRINWLMWRPATHPSLRDSYTQISEWSCGLLAEAHRVCDFYDAVEARKQADLARKSRPT